MMANLVRNSRMIFMRISSASRFAGTTSTPSGGTNTQSAGPSKNLSQASRSADGTDAAMRDAKQRTTQPIGGQTNTANAGGSGNLVTRLGLAVVLTAAAYFIFVNYVQNPGFAKNVHSNVGATKKDSPESSSSSQNDSTGKKH